MWVRIITMLMNLYCEILEISSPYMKKRITSRRQSEKSTHFFIKWINIKEESAEQNTLITTSHIEDK